MVIGGVQTPVLLSCKQPSIQALAETLPPWQLEFKSVTNKLQFLRLGLYKVIEMPNYQLYDLGQNAFRHLLTCSIYMHLHY